MRRYIVPAAKRVGADLLELAVRENAEVFSDRKNFKTAEKSVGRQTLREQLGSCSRKRIASRDIPTKSAKQFSWSRRDNFNKHLSLIMSINFRYQTFVAVSGNLGGKVPVVHDVLSSHEQEIYPTTSLDENCIEFEFQMDRNYYVDLRQAYLALILKLVWGRGYEAYKSKGVMKRGTKKR